MTMDMEEFKAMMERNKREKERRANMDFSEYAAEMGRENCLDELLNVRRNAIPLQFEDCSDDDIPIGASKSGGLPDLPVEWTYPTLSGYWRTNVRTGEKKRYEPAAMQLVLQLDLSEVAASDRDNKLPKSGMLYIFWSGELDLSNNSYFTYEFDDAENASPYRVLYYNGDKDQLYRTAVMLHYSEAQSSAFPTKRVSVSRPKYEYDASKLEDIFYSPDDDLAGEMFEAYEDWAVDGDKLLGYYKGSMNVSGPAKGDINLFQFDFHEGSLWNLYWFISEDALASLDLDKAYMDWDMD